MKKILKYKKYTAVIICVLLLAQSFLMISCVQMQNQDGYTEVYYFFDTFVSITVYDEKDKAFLPDIEEYCHQCDDLFNRHLEGSDIYRIIHAGGEVVTVDPNTVFLVATALDVCSKTDGAIDITVAPVLDLWDFTSDDENHTPPSDEAIKEALKHVDYKKVRYDYETSEVKLQDPKAAIDLGFIAKGYIADGIKDKLTASGVENAIINLGGNIVVMGTKPDGSNYNIGIKKPFTETNEIMLSASVHDTSIVTSGVYERCFTYNGKLYHHIVDPKTGYPVENNLYQVTVISDFSICADALSTSLLLLGKEKGTSLLRLTQETFPETHALFVDDQYKYYYSEGFPFSTANP